jgi:hypothetical protein
MKLHNKKNGCAGLLILALFFTSCTKFVQVAPPGNQVISSAVFSNDQSATATVVGIYSQMMASGMYFMNGAMTLYPALTSDELYNTSPNADVDPFTNNAIPSNSGIIQNNIWRNAYSLIYQVNACLEGVAGSTTIDRSVSNQLTGELKFIRALCYFYLTNIFGDIPLELSTDYRVNEKMARTPAEQVYNQIASDLQDASILLSSDYVSQDKTRPNKWAAVALLARVYLYTLNWAKADSTATLVISSGKYQLDADLDSVFLAGNNEAIWQLMPVVPSLNTAEGQYFIPSSNNVLPTYAVTPFLLSAFEPGDLRKTDWLNSASMNDQTYYYPFKYKVANGNTVTEYYTVLRFAELYLIRAEAQAEQNNLSGAVADLNIIRNRAGLPDAIANDQASLLSTIAHENQIEFFCEWGHRWFDLKRTGHIDQGLGNEKSGWKPTDALYPIPFSEIQTNPYLTQNAGYQ